MNKTKHFLLMFTSHVHYLSNVRFVRAWVPSKIYIPQAEPQHSIDGHMNILKKVWCSKIFQNIYLVKFLHPPVLNMAGAAFLYHIAVTCLYATCCDH